MEITEKKYPVKKLVAAFHSGSLLRNAEYQRGEAWREHQKAAFVDSLFRAYPVPALFLFVVENAGLDEKPSLKYEIVDGQQRLVALRDFKDGKIRLLGVGEHSKLRLPKSVREKPAPWAGKSYSELSEDLKTKFESFEITVFEIGTSAHPDEVRDLFIRLQSGTALSRQQIRDAWPGNLGPFIESIAGKLDRRPAEKLFSLIDKRGQITEDDEVDEYVGDRQLAAQLLRIFLARELDPANYPSVTANALDSLYHEQTDWNSEGPSASRFIEILRKTAKVFEKLRAANLKVKKFRRVEVSVLMMYFQDLTKSANSKVDAAFVEAVSKSFAEARGAEPPKGGKSSSPTLLKQYYEWWRERSPDCKLIRLDSRRVFPEDQKAEIRKRDGGKCQISSCGELVSEEDGEYDHFPIPYRDGGATEVSNGRLVHKTCHPRGRPVSEE